jgi:DNA polymerase I
MSGSTDINLHWVQTLEEAWALKRWLGERRPGGWLAIDTEGTGFDWWRDRLRTVQFGDRHDGWCVEWSEWAGLIKECTAAYDGPIAMHNAKFDLHFLEHNGVPMKRWLVHDTRAMCHILNPDKLSGLKAAAGRLLGPWAKHGEAELKESFARGGYNFATIPIELIWKYAAFDTCITAQVAEDRWPYIAGGYQGIYDLELASTQVLLDMEKRGILTDLSYFQERWEDWSRDLKGIEARVEEEFGIKNPNSDKQVTQYLQAQGWRPLVFTEKGNIQLDADILGGIPHPLAAQVLEWRKLDKLVHTYVGNMIDFADKDQRLHCSINPLGARTGRMSASRPNLQNVPKRDVRIRDGFIAGQGHVLISADYDQIEARLYAHYSGDKTMLEAIRYGDAMQGAGYKGYDVHSMAARIVFQYGMDAAVPEEARDRIKGVSFGKMYGSGLEKFAATAGLSIEAAAGVMAMYEAAFPETRKGGGFLKRVESMLYQRERELGDPHVLTAYGRKEPCWPREAYKGVNYLIQGTAADVLKDRMVALSKTWVGAYMLIPIHDEILFEVPEEAKDEAIQVIQQVMPEMTKFAVPLTTDAEAFRIWGDKYRKKKPQPAPEPAAA